MANDPPVPVRAPLEGGATAPIITFDTVPFLGAVAGQPGLTLEAVVHDEGPDGKGILRRIAVAHLRGGPAAMASLRAALDNLALMQAEANPQQN